MDKKLGWHEVFEELDPPPRGLEALRARIDRREAASQVRGWPPRSVHRIAAVAAVAVAFAVLGVAGLTWIGHPESSAWSGKIAGASNPALVRLGLRSASTDPVTVPPVAGHRMAVEQVALDRPGVAYYRVVTLDAEAADLQPDM
jgi:hypothetical protein